MKGSFASSNHNGFQKWFAAVLLILALATSGFVPASAAERGQAVAGDVQPQDVPTDRIIIKYRPATAAFSNPEQAEQMERLSAAAGVTLQYARPMSGRAHVLLLPERLPLEQVRSVSAKLMTLAEVDNAEPDQLMQITLTPNDPLYLDQWHYYDTYGINLPAAWDITTGSSAIVVADIDTGITNHADLSGRTVPGYDFIDDTAVSNDGDGRDADPSDPGDWIVANECYYRSPAQSSSWHGTHTAGTIGAASDNGLGVAGVNWNSYILPIRVLGKCGGYTSDIVDGMRWAAGLTVSGVPDNANPAKVMNLSLGGSGACSSTWQNAINEINAAGAVVVVSAGNSNADAKNYTPSSCDGVITVAATDRGGDKASYSNWGTKVEIAAPGGETNNPVNGVLSTLNTGTTVPVADTYAYYQGTSMAAPHVTGVVSLMFSLNPNLTPAEILQIIQSTAQPFPAGSNCITKNCGSGIVDAAAAVNAIPPTITSFEPDSGLPGDSVALTGLGFNRVNGVNFNGGASATFTINSDTSIDTTVPAGAYTGPITLLFPGGSSTSSTDFTLPIPPAPFDKISPTDGATGQPTSLTLSWGSAGGATSYEYCYDDNDDDVCSGWTDNLANTSVDLAGLDAEVTYYWQVRAINSYGTTYANGSETDYWSFTTAKTPTDDPDYSVQYDGWTGALDVLASGGGYRSASLSGQSLVYKTTVSTNTFNLLTYIGPDQGKAQVLVDGKVKSSLDLYSATPAYTSVTVSGLPLRKHTITVKVLGQKNALSTGTEVRVDGFVVGAATIDDNDVAVKYSKWSAKATTSAYGGSYRSSASRGAIVTIQFAGTSFTWITAMGKSYGKADIYVDGAYVQTVDLYSASTVWQYEVTVSGLADTSHTVEIRVLGTKNSRATGKTVIFDGFMAE